MQKYALFFFLILLPACFNTPSPAHLKTIPAPGAPVTDHTAAGRLDLYLHACALFTEGKYAETLDVLKHLISLYPDYYPAYEKMVFVHREDKTITACRDFFQQLISANANASSNYLYYYSLGLAAAAAMQWDEAITCYQKAIEAAPGFCPAYQKLADAFLAMPTKGDPVQEIEKKFGDYLAVPANAPYAAFGLGCLYTNIYRFDMALKFMNRAAASGADMNGAPYHQLGRIYYNTGRMKEALEVLENAYNSYHSSDNPENECIVMMITALCYSGLGDLPKSLEINNQNLVLARQLGNKAVEANILNSIGIIHYNMNEYEKALAFYTDSLKLSREAGDKKQENSTYLNIGVVYQAMGDYLNALEYFENGVQIARELNLKTNVARTYTNIAINYAYIGNISRRLEYFRKSLQLTREIGNKADEAIILNNLCDVYIYQGDYEKAVLSAGEALTIAKQLNLAITECYSLFKLGIAHLSLEEYAKAALYLQEALDKARALQQRVLENYLLIMIARIYSAEKNYNKARELCLAAIELGMQLEAENYIYEVQNELAVTFHKTGEYAKALEYYRKAINSIETLRTGLADESFKTTFMENKIQTYENMVNLFYDMYTRDKDINSARMAFTCAEQARARSFRDMLYEGNMNIKQGIDPSLLTRYEELTRSFSAANSQLQDLKAGGDALQEEIAALQEQLTDIDHQEENLEWQIARANPRYMETAYPRAVLIEDIQEQLLDDTTVFLEYMVTDDRLFLWRITKKDFVFYPLDISREELRLETARIWNFISARLEMTLFPGMASGLYTKILEPAVKDLQDGKHILISGNDVLNYLPFELLMSQEGGYVINRHPVYYIPSAVVLDILTHREKARCVQEKLFAIGDPVLKNTGSGNPASLRGVLDYVDFSRLPALPGAGEELEKLAALFPGGNVYTQEKACKDIIKTPGLLKQFKYIHFATHALINQEKPQFSGLLLSRGKDPADDGFLTMREIFNLELEADLVVLSACSTGIGREARGEGLISLARAFFYAGASSVVASLWRVDDKATALLMAGFYKNLASGMKTAEALRQAKLWLMQQDAKYRHPYYWAAFILVGVDM